MKTTRWEFRSNSTLPGLSLAAFPCFAVVAACRRMAVALGAASALVIAMPVGATDPSMLQPCVDAGEMQRAVQLLNALRARGAPCSQVGVATSPPLAWEPRLANTAGEHATDLAKRDEISHLDARQRGFKLRLASSGYDARAAGENLAVGQPDFATTLQSWVDSPVHCATLMTPAFSDVGLACVQRTGSRYERFWVAHLGVPQKRR